ncbi:DUF2586 family protein [Flammeovirga sp. SJP92]|uniref:DUF2586 family protein n=1 Tax=Flammeovirga sp. SJP92 TaxID=1775430 RepID=UPI0007887B47|nr:DUF2586 family protein [Flammeovirga sp. SJP92]KXX70781.1 hypothetical protein AVL50_07175 [Flammeovirga sp. SJP92]
MATKGVIIKSGKIGANTLGGSDAVSALLMHGIAVAAKIALGEVKTLFSLDDAEALGLDEQYDIDNKVRVWYHIKEFYRMVEAKTELYIMLADQTTDLADLLEDTTGVHAKKLLSEGEGKIKQLGVCFNPEDGYVTVPVNGLDTKVSEAIPKAQLLYEWSHGTFKPVNILLEGYHFGGDGASAEDLRDITGVEATHVSLVIGQDYDYAETLDALGKKHGAVGTALGCVAKIPVNFNIAEVETMNLTDATRGEWLTPGISSHVTSKSIESQWDTLDEKGYIFPINYVGIDGARWNDDHTCTPIVVDADGNMNEHSISLGRTMNKAKRTLRTALLPKVKSTHAVDPSTGKLAIQTIKYFESIGDQALGRMETANEIVESQTVVDPESDLLTPPKELKVDFAMVPYGHIGQISGTINLKQSL